MSRSFHVAFVAGVACVLGTVMGTSASALPGGGTGDENGYEVSVQVTYSGDAAPEGGGTSEVHVEVVCYWGPFNPMVTGGPNPGDGSDMQAVLDYIDWGWAQPHNMGYGWVQVYGNRTRFEEAAANPQPNAQWFSPYCSIPMTDERAIEFAGGESMRMAIQAQLFTVNNPPPPVVDPEDLAIEAREVMVIDEPEVDRNPKIVDGPAGATFVNVPTWFWVTNPESVGDVDGIRTIRAEVVGSGVWAEVTATTDGLSIASPAGSARCEPEVALRPWTPGADDTSGCTVAFSRASVGHPSGYPVSTATEWAATWAGQEQDGTSVGGDLPPLQRAATVLVPVAEVQTVVKRVSGR